MIRQADHGDEETFRRFNSSLSERDLPEDGFAYAFRENLKQENNRYLIAEKNGRPAGMGSCHVQWLLHHAAPIAEIQELYVLPEFRSRGIGILLIEALVAFARSKNAEQIELSTHRKRIDAHRFYAREGFSDSHLKWVRSITAEHV